MNPAKISTHLVLLILLKNCHVGTIIDNKQPIDSELGLVLHLNDDVMTFEQFCSNSVI